jgi:hypothetical protein
MEKILNSIEELYQLISNTLPEGYIECANCDKIVVEQHGVPVHPTGYFIVTDLRPHDRVKIEYGKNYKLVIADGRIYKYA